MTPDTNTAEPPQATKIAQSKPTSANPSAVWANPSSPPQIPSRKSDLEAKFEAMRARNWITERMVQQYQAHWHCSREEALERLLAKAGS